MKLGEALSLRALQASQLNDLRGRVSANAVTQEGSNPQEPPRDVIAAYDLLSEQHARLVERINRTNVETGLISKLQQREHLRRRRNTLEAAAQAVEGTGALSSLRYMRSELRTVPQLQAGDLHRDIDHLVEEIRALDAEVQAQNWQVDLVDLP